MKNRLHILACACYYVWDASKLGSDHLLWEQLNEEIRNVWLEQIKAWDQGVGEREDSEYRGAKRAYDTLKQIIPTEPDLEAIKKTLIDAGQLPITS